MTKTKRKLQKTKTQTQTQTQKNKIREKKLVNEWKGKLLGKNTHIQIFTISNTKRKPIIKITAKDMFKTVDGPLLTLQFLPPTKELFNFKGKTIYRLSLYYGAKGSHQGGPMVGYREHRVLFSENEKQINKIGEILSKYTKDIRNKKK
tara:strand:- start:210 stop:653 length:444 start_codon:yes stop_codon:yes gene_type:complete